MATFFSTDPTPSLQVAISFIINGPLFCHIFFDRPYPLPPSGNFLYYQRTTFLPHSHIADKGCVTAPSETHQTSEWRPSVCLRKLRWPSGVCQSAESGVTDTRRYPNRHIGPDGRFNGPSAGGSKIPFRIVARDRIIRKGAPTGAVASHDPLTHKPSAGRVHESRNVRRLHASNFSHQ